MKLTDEKAENKKSMSKTLYESDQKSSSNHKVKESNKQDLNNQDMGKQKNHANPTRYGDWEMGGRCIDF